MNFLTHYGLWLCTKTYLAYAMVITMDIFKVKKFRSSYKVPRVYFPPYGLRLCIKTLLGYAIVFDQSELTTTYFTKIEDFAYALKRSWAMQ